MSVYFAHQCKLLPRLQINPFRICGTFLSFCFLQIQTSTNIQVHLSSLTHHTPWGHRESNNRAKRPRHEPLSRARQVSMQDYPRTLLETCHAASKAQQGSHRCPSRCPQPSLAPQAPQRRTMDLQAQHPGSPQCLGVAAQVEHITVEEPDREARLGKSGGASKAPFCMLVARNFVTKAQLAVQVLLRMGHSAPGGFLCFLTWVTTADSMGAG